MYYGRITPLVTIVAHATYGVILGAFYVPRRAVRWLREVLLSLRINAAFNSPMCVSA